MFSRYLLLAIVFVFSGVQTSFAQEKDDEQKLFAGPMISYIDDYSTQMWMMVGKDVKEIKLKFEDFDQDRSFEMNYKISEIDSYNRNRWYREVHSYSFGDKIPVTMSLEQLRPDTEYKIDIYLDEELAYTDFEIFTPRNYLADVYFMFGSGLYMNDNKNAEAMLDQMVDTDADLMVWGGNNVQVSADKFDSFRAIIDEYQEIRENEKVDALMQKYPQIATWDMHDFGLNSSDKRFALKDSTLMAFNLFWPNAPKKVYNYSFRDFGVYKSYEYEDVEIFMMDDRMFRTEKDDLEAGIYGQRQIDRLIMELMGSGSPFKFIVSGEAFTQGGLKEYSAEYNELMDRLHKARIPGVVFLSGNAKDSKIRKEDRKNAYPLYELMCKDIAPQTGEAGNYSRMKVSGALGERVCTFEVYDKDGNSILKKMIHESELKY